ncbi:MULTISPECIES: hypothetical protein [unclassified Geodermatophilus]
MWPTAFMHRATSWTGSLILALGATALVPTLTACGTGSLDGDAGQVCPAVDYGRTLVVRLTGDWPAAEGRTVVARCSSPCGAVQLGREDLGPEVTGALVGSTANLSTMATPDFVAVTVVEPDGHQTRVDAALDWTRVGGTEECGGPMEAEVDVPLG